MQDLNYHDRHWHEKCFMCRDCKVLLGDKHFASKEELIFCADCYDNNFAQHCDGCTKVFKAGTLRSPWSLLILWPSKLVFSLLILWPTKLVFSLLVLWPTKLVLSLLILWPTKFVLSLPILWPTKFVLSLQNGWP